MSHELLATFEPEVLTLLTCSRQALCELFSLSRSAKTKRAGRRAHHVVVFCFAVQVP